jgi:MFS family permease
VVALPSIQHTLHASASTLQWTVAFALLLITGGWLGDRYGGRTVFLTGLAGFTLASVLTGTRRASSC